jgi:hypothetical protein
MYRTNLSLALPPIDILEDRSDWSIRWRATDLISQTRTCSKQEIELKLLHLVRLLGGDLHRQRVIAGLASVRSGRVVYIASHDRNS